MRSFLRWVQSLSHAVKAGHALRKHDYDGMIQHCTRAIEISPEDLDYYHERAYAYWHKGELGLAIRDYTKAVELKPDNFRAYHARGLLYLQRGYLAQAIGDFGQVIELTDGLAAPWFARARCFAEKKDYERALADLEEGLKIEQEDEQALELQAWCRHRLEHGEPEK